MPRRPQFKVLKTRDGWQVNVPASVTKSGKRERHSHETRDKAKEHATELREKYKQHGEAAAIIRPSLADAATAAEKILKPWDVSLVDAAKIVAEIKKRESASKPLDEAVDAWLDACEGLRDRTLGSYRQTANRLKASFADGFLASITADDIQNAISPPGAAGAAVLGRIRNSRAFWRWAAKRGWCDADVFKAVEAPKSGRNQKEITILTPAEAKKLLQLTEQHYPEAVASYALQLFAGIRVEEIGRLEARHVTEAGIEMSADITKKGRRRHINPSPTLMAWLNAYPFEPCPNWKEVDKACRRLAGWNLQSRLLDKKQKKDKAKGKNPKKLAPPPFGRWPQNALRHSHASYAIAAGVPLESLLFKFGHTGNPSVLREHYVGRASKKEAIAFFGIGPNGDEIPAIAAA
jgi:site-specific recombinase XerD